MAGIVTTQLWGSAAMALAVVGVSARTFFVFSGYSRNLGLVGIRTFIKDIEPTTSLRRHRVCGARIT